MALFDIPPIVLSDHEDSEAEPPAIHVHVQLPTGTQTTEQGVLVWTWVRTLNVPIKSLLRIAPLRPWRWIRFACGVTMGTARGALYSSANILDGDQPLDLDSPIPPDTQAVYFHVPEEDREGLVPAEPDLGKPSRKSGSTVHSEHSEHSQALQWALEELVVARDRSCVVTRIVSSNINEVAHLLPRAKKDAYIENVTRLHVQHGYPGAQLVTSISDVRNAILVSLVVHGCLGKTAAIMKMPNFAFPDAPEGWEFHALDEVDAAALAQHQIPHGKAVAVPANRDTWPPSPLFDQVYASAVFHCFGPQDGKLKEDLKKLCARYHSPGRPMSPTHRQKAALDDAERQGRADSQIQSEERQRGFRSRSSHAPGDGAADRDRNDVDVDENGDDDDEIPQFAIWQRFLPPDTQRRVYAALLHEAEAKASASSIQRVLEWQRHVE